MASFPTSTLFSLYLALTLTLATANLTFSHHFATTKLTPTPRKMSRLHFYFHDIASGKNPTAIRIIRPRTTAFGTTVIIDDPLTVDTKPGSKQVGRAQGLYALASQNHPALLMAINLAFTHGRYNGSTLTVMGRNLVVDAVREMPVVGGSGVFRFACGYALLNTVRFNPKTGDAVVHYNVTVMHA